MRPASERDEGWFTNLYATHYPDIVRYGLRRLPDGDAAAELAQDVFVVVWRRRSEVPERALPWLYGVARHVVANRWRALHGSPSLLPLAEADQVPTRLAEPEATTPVLDLRRALRALPEADQEILRLVGWEDLSVADAAVVLHCTRTAAAVRLYRARRRLRSVLAAPNPARAARPANAHA
ncbi:sigma-70 family RNA polymerase sigma factor [Micromonospora sp. DSM 115977]|uniref:Sigma-70 family RNA polymerase sigma factor n=1 Tax=Micromonospora reichwaldensis TaxID=3075516 RepID=A0ABU2X186_9ACTN|nr:sigma-70 family RNA polymerase sigma factor [Micromonospora sp. DSM 115977]MDT0531943.1 sigma-70 family RNA polymerase sigma factor [Micromonospora sp. DSM 115977]